MLYLNESQPKNYTTCLKDDKFLNFFFSNLRPNEVDEYNLKDSEITKEELKVFPYSSPCWGEQNLVKAHSYPIVFRELNDDSELLYGGTLTSKFEPENLAQDQNDLFVYPVKGHKYLEYGTFDLGTSMQLADRISNDGLFEWIDGK